MKPHLQLKFGQHLTLTPQLQQSIRLLQLSTLELNQEIEQILQENPLLEREDDAEDAVREGAGSEAGQEQAPQANDTDYPESEGVQTASEEMDWNDYGSISGDDDEEGGAQTPAASATLREHLLGQVALLQLSLRDRALVSALVDALDEDGYLEQTLEEIAAGFEAEPPIESEEMDVALRYLQNLDPAGVGARNLSECLSLQLKSMPDSTPALLTALKITDGLLDLLAARDVGKLKKILRIDDMELRAARQLILKLNPKPGAQFGVGETHYVIPDVYVRKLRGAWVASLNPQAMPKLRINRVYADILARHRENAGQLANHLQEAKWLIKNVQQRFDTILRVSQAIVDRQRKFFEHGEVAMRPLVLREIAEAVDLHESTISRVTTHKYMMTPRGLYELKYFFGSHVATEAGGVCSSTAIRALIKQLIAAEDAMKPLSDGQLAEVLAQQGIVVARRTVAKYRESLHIPTANMRKSS